MPKIRNFFELKVTLQSDSHSNSPFIKPKYADEHTQQEGSEEGKPDQEVNQIIVNVEMRKFQRLIENRL